MRRMSSVQTIEELCTCKVRKNDDTGVNMDCPVIQRYMDEAKLTEEAVSITLKVSKWRQRTVMVSSRLYYCNRMK